MKVKKWRCTALYVIVCAGCAGTAPVEEVSTAEQEASSRTRGDGTPARVEQASDPGQQRVAGGSEEGPVDVQTAEPSDTTSDVEADEKMSPERLGAVFAGQDGSDDYAGFDSKMNVAMSGEGGEPDEVGGAPALGDFCDKNDIRQVVGAKSDAIRYCFEKQLATDPTLSGKIITRWNIELDGSVKGASTVSSTVQSPEVEGCIVRTIEQLRFQKPSGGICRIDYPFVFNVSK
jgi:hypothetical protein